MVARESALLSDAGHQVRLVEFENGRGARSLVDLAVAAHNPLAARRVGREIAQFRPDVVHVHNTWFSASPTVMSEPKHRGVPVVATLHNYRAICAGATLMRDGVECVECLGSSALPAIRHRCVNGSLPQSIAGAAVVAVRQRGERHGSLADRYIAPTDVVASWLRRGGIPGERVIVLPHFLADPGPVTAAPAASSTVVFAGRLSPEKGIGEAIEAWLRMPSRPLGARFIVAGEGPMEAELRALRAEGVEFVGRISSEAVGDLIESARFVVVPSVWSEPFGLVYLEAMARGVGVLSSRMGAATEFLGTGGGWLVSAGDVSELSSKMFELLDPASGSDGLVEEAGRLARMAFEAGYSAESHLERLLNVYRGVTVSK